MAKLTFKKDKPQTGLMTVGHPYLPTSIKLDGMLIGTIYPPNYQKQHWEIGLIVSQTGGNCPWGWLSLKRKYDSEPEARQFIKDNLETIRKKYDLHPIEPFDD